MAHFVEGGTGLFNALVYGETHPGTQNFIEQQLHNASHILNEAGQRFMSGFQALHSKVSGSEAARMARAAARTVRSIWQKDDIQELVDIGRLQHAPLKMQRWIMAEPTIRALYHQQRCDGYSDTYVDVAPGEIGDDHYDYRRATNGMVQEREDGSWFANCYYDELLPEDRELAIDEQVDIQTTWAAVVAAIRKGKEDPTSRYNADL